ncbi:hypothetical protein PR048_018193 [Dryococelus australis]|uniref:Uncharacterized protein n=1 Tax=Dryococelus australis TaxID=614101 RepID=A0ABQ9HBR0_9NEOP|nr:hypothetical protein PR048_018193 [Dryococelus australis]
MYLVHCGKENSQPARENVFKDIFRLDFDIVKMCLKKTKLSKLYSRVIKLSPIQMDNFVQYLIYKKS